MTALNAIGIIGATIVAGLLIAVKDGDGETHPVIAAIVELGALAIIFSL